MRLIGKGDLTSLLFIPVIGVLSWFSSRSKDALVRCLAFADLRLSGRKRQRSAARLHQALADRVDRSQEGAIIEESFYEFWREPFSWKLCRDEKAQVRTAEIAGLDHLRAALDHGKGVILWESSVFGRRALTKHILHANGVAVCQVHAEHHLGGLLTGTWVRERVIRPFFDKCESVSVSETVYVPRSPSLTFGRALAGRLRNNTVVCVAGDGRDGQRLFPVSFLGGTALFATGMVSLAKATGATILPIFCVPSPDGGSRVIIEAGFHIDPAGDRETVVEETVTRFARLLETYIRRHPGQVRSWAELGGSGS